ncbi:unnamed protein product [Trifolium pratense]|uniref:Uncharacterized protein n=1 Tax=Trifolium pratense TaxID=57577 RepID=A0ACB0LUF2_TRIPR|nr:unnamed protein product [Trifolium pratense]
MANVLTPRSSFNLNPEVTIHVVNVNVYNYSIMGVETNPLHGLMAFIFFVLLGYLQISYPDNPSAFQVHPKTMFVSIASFLLYCMFFWIKIKFVITRIDAFMEVFGSLSIISLVLMFLPNNWGLFGYTIIYTIWFISHVLILMIKLCFIGLRPKMRRKLQPLLPNTSIDLN